ncbi:MAG: hypothetical protein JY451_04960 [Erythrobacter sp.]|nr:MAG: hypothetical protein JY451_04960 [Erythrobacter sp.]
MGEYEPDDSRKVTLEPGHEPGGIKRTGPQEDGARRVALARERAKERGERAEDGDQKRPGDGTDPRHRG